ncbi:MAG: polyprenyl synthetase family protein [Aquimonas sp.]|nr:polyprenyl synthetase family protein [Aquimonas sp.]
MHPESLLRDWLARCEVALDAALPAADRAPVRLHTAMRYAVLGGGKRFRPLLVYATGHSLGTTADQLDTAATAVELIHAYSLIHDDLPAMDDDALRRGRPTVHIAFDEATAILAGDALQTCAFETLCRASVPDNVARAMLVTLAQASGAAGMAGGQALDIDATGQQQSLDALQHMHSLKTGALIRASVRLAALVAQADATTLHGLDSFATALGLAFQIRDDLLDIEGDAAELGKTAGKDVAQGKSTYPALLGLQGAYAALQEQRERMKHALSSIHGDTSALAELARRASDRRS